MFLIQPCIERAETDGATKGEKQKKEKVAAGFPDWKAELKPTTNLEA